MGGNSMAELLRYHIVSCGDEFAVLFFKELFEDIDAETETAGNWSHRVKIASRKLRPKLSIVGKEIVL